MGTDKREKNKAAKEKEHARSVDEDVSFNLENFVYIKGDIRFEEDQDGKIRCGGCNKIYSRIIGHLKQNTDCKRNIDMEDLESEWKKFSAKRRSAKYYEKQKKEK